MGQMCTTTRDLSIAQSFTSIIVIYMIDHRKVHGRTCTFLWSLFPSIVEEEFTSSDIVETTGILPDARCTRFVTDLLFGDSSGRLCIILALS